MNVNIKNKEIDNQAKQDDELSISETMKKYKTVKGNHCSDCGNPWWFDKDNSWVCTTCRKTKGK